MPSSANAPEILTSYEISVVQATGVKRVKLTLCKGITAYIQIDAADQSWRTTDVAWTDSGNIRWDDRHTLLPLPNSAKITFSLFRNSRLNLSKSLVGRLEIRLAELLELCARHHGEELTLSLEKKNQRTGELTVQIKNASTTAFESAIQHLPETSESRLAAAADAITAADEVVDSSLVGSFASLMESMNVLVKIGDEIAKIHPWVNLAWNVLSVGLKMVKAQQDRNTKITKLIQTMQSIYSTVVGTQSLKDDAFLQDVLDRILKQTVVCGFFIQEYTSRHTSAGGAVKDTFSSVDDLIARYQGTFEQLRDDFMGRIATRTALITSDIATAVQEMRFDQLLGKLKPEEMNEVKRGICLPNTRVDTIDTILSWYSDDSDDRASVMWMFGLAGTGKSTLSTTIARMVEAIGLLGAYFFFDRQLQERDSSTLIRTLAFQLAQFDAKIGVKVAQIVKDRPNIANMPLATQFSELLSAAALGDVVWSRGPVLVVIDALDESDSETERRDLIQVLSEGFSNLPHFLRILVVSRPVRDISGRFEGSAIRHQELVVDSNAILGDIVEFIRSRLHAVREANIKYLKEILQNWPSDNDIRSLAIRAAGLFIWAATACRLIDESHDPKERMDELIERHSMGPYAAVFTSLHHLYKTALQSAGNWDDESFCRDFRDILGTIICAQTPLSCHSVDALLGLRRPSMQTVSRLGSVLRGSKEEPIRILHTSFHDYLTLREPLEPWAIDNERYNMHVASHCITHLEQELRENMCNLTLSHPIADESLPDSVLYASKYWIEHVCAITDGADTLGDAIYRFMRKHLLHWVEALVIVKAYDVALRSLPRLLAWIQRYLPGNQLYHFAHDALRFAQYFAATIPEHPLLVYASALPFTPHDTIIYKTFHHDKLPRVVSGGEPTWPPLLQALHVKVVSGSSDKTIRVWDALTGQEALPPIQGHEDVVWCAVFSPDGSKIVSGSSDKTIRVWDALTGQEALPPIQGHKGGVWSVAISPDGSKIASVSYGEDTIRVWNTLTGQEDLPPLQGHAHWVRSVAFSPDGYKIASGSDDKTILIWDAFTGHNTLPPLQGHQGYVNSVALSPGGSKIISGSDDKTIRVWDALTCRAVLPPLQGHQDAVKTVMFSPDGCKIVSGSSDKTIRVWDAITGQELHLPFQGHAGTVWAAAFSPDGCKIVSGSSDKTIRVWNALTGQELLLPFQGHEKAVRTVAFSPDGSKIVSGSSDKTIRVWDALTGQETTSLLRGHEDWLTGHVSFTPDGSKIVSRTSDRTSKVWDVHAGEAQVPLPVDDEAHSLVHLGKDGYFVEVSTGCYLSKVPASFTLNPCHVPVRHESSWGSSWFGWGRESIPVIIHFPLS